MAACSVWWRLMVPRRVPVAAASPVSMRAASSATGSARTRTAASSMASGMPSSRRQSRMTCGRSAAVSVKPLTAAAARCANSSTASPALGDRGGRAPVPGTGSGPEPEHLLAGHVQRLPARRQDPDVARLAQHRRCELRAGAGQVLAGVEDQQQLPAAQLAEHRVESPHAPRSRARARPRRSATVSGSSSGSVRPDSSTRQLPSAQSASAAARSARRVLPTPPGPGDRDEPRAVEQAGQPGEFAAPADEPGNVGRQLPAPLPGAGTPDAAGEFMRTSRCRGPPRIIPHRGRGPPLTALNPARAVSTRRRTLVSNPGSTRITRPSQLRGEFSP